MFKKVLKLAIAPFDKGVMDQGLEITRNQHVDHLAASMPTIMLMYTAQLYVLQQLFPNYPLANYALFCALCIVTYVAYLYLYAVKVQTFIENDNLVTHSFFGRRLEIPLIEITNVFCPNEEQEFNTLYIKWNRKVVPLKYIDNPAQVKALLLERTVATAA